MPTPAATPFDPELSTAENLARRGLTYRPAAKPALGDRGPFAHQRDIVDAAGVVVFTGDCFSANRWMQGGGAS